MREKRRIISEAAKEIGVEPYTLRTWEDELQLSIPRNDKGYRYYGDKEIQMLKEIMEMKDQGLSMDEIRTKLYENVIPFPRKNDELKVQSKMDQFQNVMVKIVGRALNEQRLQFSKDISYDVTTQINKELEYQFRLREEAENKRYKKIDELIRNQQKVREELAATNEKRRWFGKRRK